MDILDDKGVSTFF